MALWRALLPLVIYAWRPALGQSVVEVEVGAQSVSLPCKTPAPGNFSSVVWTRGFESESEEVHSWYNQRDNFRSQSPLFKGRTQMKPDALELKNPTLTDSGTYTCVTREEGKITDYITVELRVKEPPPVPVPGIIGLIVLCIIIILVLLVIVLLLVKIYKRMKQHIERSKEASIGLISRTSPLISNIDTYAPAQKSNTYDSIPGQSNTNESIHMYEN